MLTMFEDDDLERTSTSQFQHAISWTDKIYSSNLKSSFKLCDLSLLDTLIVSPMHIFYRYRNTVRKSRSNGVKIYKP